MFDKAVGRGMHSITGDLLPDQELKKYPKMKKRNVSDIILSEHIRSINMNLT